MGKGCPNCHDSEGEKVIDKLLTENKLQFIRQKSFIDCKNERPLYFDFYLSESNLCIEFDGIQHFEPIAYWGGEENFIKIKKRDEIKNEYCNNNNIRLIRIKYNDDILKTLTDSGVL